MRLSRTFGLAAFILLSVIVYSQSDTQQKPPDVYPSQTVLKATTRLVVVDVVATDSKGQRVSDLRAEDFSILENGTPQKISNFSAQLARPSATVQTVAMPVGAATNAPQARAASLNVILLDALNTEHAGYSYARDELLKFLDGMPSGQPIAVYGLENKLMLLQDFTTDMAALKKVIMKFKPPAYQ